MLLYWILQAIVTQCYYNINIIIIIYRVVQFFLRPFNNYSIFFLQLPLSFQSPSINPFSPISPLIPSAQVSLGLPRFLLPGGRHFITSFGNLPSSMLWTSKLYCLVNKTFTLKAPNVFCVTGTNRTVISGETKSYTLLAFRSKLCSRIRLLVALPAVSVHRVRTDVTQPANKAFHCVQRCPTDLLPDQKLASVCSRVWPGTEWAGRYTGQSLPAAPKPSTTDSRSTLAGRR